MSIDQRLLNLQNHFYLNKLDIDTLRILRFSFGVTLSVAIAYGLNWSLSYMLPLFVIAFLKAPKPCLSFKQGSFVIRVTIKYLLLGFVLSQTILNYPFVFLTAIALLIFHILNASMKGANSFAILFSILGLLVITMQGLTAPALAWGVMMGLIYCVVLSLLLSWLMFTIFPDPANTYKDELAATVDSTLDINERYSLAIEKTLIILPVVILLFSYNLSSYLVMLILIIFLIMSPDLTAGKKGALFLVIGNTLGGIVAILFYKLLIAVPEYFFLIALSLLTSLVLAKIIYTGKPLASALTGSAATTIFLLIGQGTMVVGDDEVGDKFYFRILLVILAGLYVVGSFVIMESFRNKRIEE